MKKYKNWNNKKTQKWAKNWHKVELAPEKILDIIAHLCDEGTSVSQWMEDSIECPYTLDNRGVFYFAKKSNAVLFKITWGGD